jgi:hypothetical protein
MFDSPDLPLATLRFDGPRFAGHSLDVECTRELIAYRTLVLECAKELWKRRHPDRARLPRNFDSGFRLDVDRIDPGSASLPLRRVRDHSQAALDFDDEFDEAAALIDDTIAAANQDRLLPEALPSNVVALFSDFGSSMRIDETLYLRSRRSSNEAAYTASARQRLANWVLPNYEDLVDITGEVRMANVGPGAFRLQLPDGGPLVEGRFEASHEAVVLQALKDHRQARLRVTGQGEFSTSERLLRRLLRVDHVEVLRSDSIEFDASARPIWEVLAEVGTDAPTVGGAGQARHKGNRRQGCGQNSLRPQCRGGAALTAV